MWYQGVVSDIARILLRVPADVAERATEQAAAAGVSRNTWLAQAIERATEPQDPPLRRRTAAEARRAESRQAPSGWNPATDLRR